MKKILMILLTLLFLIGVIVLVRHNGEIVIESNPTAQQNQSVSIDLNNDGSPETVELSQTCGTGGCNVRIVTTQNSTMTTVSEINLVQNLFLGTTTTQGWTDLVVETSGGGAQKNVYLLQFDGRTYPTHPEDGMEIETTEGLTKVF